MVEQELNEWDEYGTRETGPERQSNDSASCVGGAKSPGDDRECNLSEDRCLEATDAGEQDVKDGDAFNLRPGNEENPGQDGSARHNGPAVTPVDGAADRIGRETGKQEPDRGCAVKVGLGPAKVPSHGFGDQGKAVVDRSPRTDLADAQARDEQPQAGPCRPLVCMGPSTHAVPSQQPEAFARYNVAPSHKRKIASNRVEFGQWQRKAVFWPNLRERHPRGSSACSWAAKRRGLSTA